MEEIEARIDELKARAARGETISHLVGFKEDAVDLVAELREKGWTQQAISEAMEIPWGTLRRWRESGEPTEVHSQGFRPVTVVESNVRPALVLTIGMANRRTHRRGAFGGGEAAVMIGSTRNVTVWAYPKPCDLRKGHNGLSGVVMTEFEADLLSGDFFIFCNRRRTLCKVLLWDGTRLCIYNKRLEEGRFAERRVQSLEEGTSCDFPGLSGDDVVRVAVT